MPDSFWVGLQAAWFSAHSAAVLCPLLEAGYDVITDGWIYKFCYKLLLQGYSQPDLDVIFGRVRTPDAVILLTADPEAIYDRRRDFRLAELGMHAAYQELGRASFTVTRSTGWQDSHYFAVIATKGFQAEPVSVAPFTPRVTAADFTAGLTTLRMIAIYGPTNGMSSDSSIRRCATQDRIIAYLAAVARPRMAIAGDLNVIEPGHRPHLASFEDHDYSFYTRLLDLGLADAYRVMNPDGDDHSWFSDRFGSQRLDHTLASPAVGRITACGYDHVPRTRHLSDHATLLTTINLAAGADDGSSS